MIVTRAGGCLVAALVCASPLARANVLVVDGVQVVEPTCPITPLSVSAFVDSLRAELASGARARAATVVTLAIEPCDAATLRVRVSIASDPGRSIAPRDIGLEDIAVEARPRALALAVAELVRSASPPAAPPPPALVAPAPPAPEPRPFAIGIAADGLTSLFPGRATALWGGRLSFFVDGPRARLGLFADAAAGERDVDVGRVSLRSLAAGLVGCPTVSAGRFTLCPGVAGAIGWAQIEGAAAAPGVVAGSGSSLVVAARGHVDASAWVAREVSARAFVEAGYMLRGYGATVDGAPSAGLVGASLVLGLGVGIGR
ncbi:MAG TPA: hypothetical protein VK989_21165 [Polyangia bacterium]|jgi:hypothetical protein|nr:hypothetical protein [Polyangia bacterium]